MSKISWWKAFRHNRLSQKLLWPSRMQVHFLGQRVEQLHDRIGNLERAAAGPLTRRFDVDPRYLPAEGDLPIFNPGVVRANGEIVFFSRESTFLCRLERWHYYAKRPHDTRIIVHRFDDDLRFNESWVLDDHMLREAAPLGIEDFRPFHWKGSVWAIAAAVSPIGDLLRVRQVLIRLENWKIAGFTVFESPCGFSYEKNWIPVVKDERLFLIYSFEPMVVFECDGKPDLKLVKGSPGEVSGGAIRGGTPLIQCDKFFVGLVHYRLPLEKLYYPHALIALDQNFDCVELSELFYVQRPGIEFVSGLLEYKGDWLISYGLIDRVAAYCVLPRNKIAQMLVSVGDPGRS